MAIYIPCIISVHIFLIEYDVTLIIQDSIVNVMEPVLGESVTAAVCFTATLNTSINRDAIFDIFPSSPSNASLNIDFFLNASNPLTIRAGFNGMFMQCINFTVIGDNIFEGPEVASYEIRPRSLFDQVVFPPDVQLNLIMLNIMDNIGKLSAFFCRDVRSKVEEVGNCARLEYCSVVCRSAHWKTGSEYRV